MIPIGYGNYIAKSRLIAVVTSDSAPARRLRQDARSALPYRRDRRQEMTQGRMVGQRSNVVLFSPDPLTR